MLSHHPDCIHCTLCIFFVVAALKVKLFQNSGFRVHRKVFLLFYFICACHAGTDQAVSMGLESCQNKRGNTRNTHSVWMQDILLWTFSLLSAVKYYPIVFHAYWPCWDWQNAPTASDTFRLVNIKCSQPFSGGNMCRILPEQALAPPMLGQNPFNWILCHYDDM